MKIRLKQYWYNIQSSLWFLPSAMAVAAVLLAFGFIELDSTIKYDDFPVAWFIYGGQREGARSVLSTIASSMVTISGVTFSITLVALTMASSQFGPRLLRNFIADKGNQFVIGAFIATFIYSLIVLLAIRGSETDEFIPKISVVFAFLLAVLSLGVIIYFIHHVSTSIQADFIIHTSFREFKKNVDENLLAADHTSGQPPYTDLLADLKRTYILTSKVCLNDSGFIQSMDYNGSCKWARDNDAIVEWLVYPGVFATVNDVFALIHHKNSLPKNPEAELGRFIVIAYQRTPNQDLLYSLKQIVEVGVRALSPGTNDPYTAITCIQWLGEALCELLKKSFIAPVLLDKTQSIRVLRKQITFQMIVDACFDHIRLYAKSNMYVTIELLYAIEKPLAQTDKEEFRVVLREKATAVYKEIRQQYNTELLPAIDIQFQKIMQQDATASYHIV